MYYWDYYAPHWTKDEVENIRGIIQNCRKWFSPKLGDWLSDDYLNGVVSCPENYINKDIIECNSEVFVGYSYTDIKKRINKLIEFLKSDDTYKEDLCMVEEFIGFWLHLDDSEKIEPKDIISLRSGLKKLQNIELKTKKQIDKLMEYINEVPIEASILGRFNGTNITIYLKAILECDNPYYNNQEINADILIEQVIVHELFHALHYEAFVYENTEKWQSRDKSSTSVKESLADYFSYLYLIKQRDRSGKDLHNYREYDKAILRLREMWDKFKFPSYPYAGAKVFDGNDMMFYDLVYEASVEWRIPYSVIRKRITNKSFDYKKELNQIWMFKKRLPGYDRQIIKFIEQTRRYKGEGGIVFSQYDCDELVDLIRMYDDYGKYPNFSDSDFFKLLSYDPEETKKSINEFLHQINKNLE